MIPQLIFIFISLVGIGLTIREHSNPRTEKHNAFSTIIGTVLTQFILYWGGFWNEFYIPQLIMGLLVGFSIVYNIAKDGYERKQANIFTVILTNILFIILISLGNFFDPLLNFIK